MPFEDLTLLRKIDSVDDFKNKIKMAVEKNKTKQKDLQKIAKNGTVEETKQLRKRSKSEPPELSAKIPVSRKRIVIPIQKRVLSSLYKRQHNIVYVVFILETKIFEIVV
jgi:hypothetical protein